jgi:septum formation protein
MEGSARQGGFKTKGRLILASASPRRQAFLQELGLAFEVRAADINEEPAAGDSPAGFVRRLAMDKARAVARCDAEAAVLAADTVVVIDGELLGKPLDAAGADAMLKRLSGRTHEVWTGFALCRGSEVLAAREVRTEVTFIALSDALCQAYVMTGEPLDKAGAYGIQGQGGFLVERICGSYSNVVGLPLAELVTAMLASGVIVPRT